MPLFDYPKDIRNVQGLIAPAIHASEVVPSDTANLDYVARALFVGVPGNVKVTTLGGETVTFVSPIGVLPVFVVKVFATGTDATDIVALW